MVRGGGLDFLSTSLLRIGLSSNRPMLVAALGAGLALSSLVLVAVEIEKSLVRRGRLYGERAEA